MGRRVLLEAPSSHRGSGLRASAGLARVEHLGATDSQESLRETGATIQGLEWNGPEESDSNGLPAHAERPQGSSRTYASGVVTVDAGGTTEARAGVRAAVERSGEDAAFGCGERKSASTHVRGGKCPRFDFLRFEVVVLFLV